MVRAVVIPTDEDEAVRLVELGGADPVGSIVGGWSEAVDIPRFGVTVYVNEEGLVRRLAFNSRATFLWWFHRPEVRGRAILVGDAVVVGMPDADGEDTDIPEEALRKLSSAEPHAIVLRLLAGADVSPDLASNVALPLVSGSPEWFVSAARYGSCFAAMAWAIVVSMQPTGKLDCKVVPVSELPKLVSS